MNMNSFIWHSGNYKTLWVENRSVVQFSSVQFSRTVVSDSLRSHGLQHTRLPCPSPTPEAYSNSGPSHRWCHPTISSSAVSLSSAFNLFQDQGLFQWVGSSHQVAKVLKLQLQHPYFSEYSGLISFRTDQFDHPAVQGTLKSPFQHHNSKSISSSSLSLLYGPTLTSIHD